MDKQRSYASGAQKRNKKRDAEENLKKNKKIESFFSQQRSTSLNTVAIPSSYEDTPPTPSSSTTCTDERSVPSTSLDATEMEVTISNKENESTAKQHYNKFENIINTDMGNFQTSLDDDVRKFVISSEPFQPRGPFKMDPLQSNRHFSETYYNCAYKYGKIRRQWLCYSQILDMAYCEPCWLFSSEKNSQWRSGISDWQGLSKKIKIHANSLHHVKAYQIYDNWKKNRVIDKNTETVIKHEASFWRMVLERLFDITLMLTKNSLAFRGHREEVGEGYNGNFLSQVNLLAKYDDIMKQVLNKPKGTVKYLSPAIQNEIIECLGTNLEKSLINEINSSPFFSLIVDTTQDITKIDQMSIIFRYVQIIRDETCKPLKLNIKETFMGFHNTTNHSASGMTEQILSFLNSQSINLKKCRGQGYDGANVLKGAYNSVQTRIKNIEPLAEYVHCASHNLNLVINDTVSGCKEVVNFFTLLQEIYTFFGNSINRWDLLSNFTGDSQITLKRLNPTRWSSRISSLKAVKLRFLDILKALTEIMLRSTKKDESNDATNIIKKMSNFEFVFICVILESILSEINYASKVLQNKDIDFQTASNVLYSCKTKIEKFRDIYDELKEEAVRICAKWKIVPEFASKRRITVKRHFDVDEISHDHKFENEEKNLELMFLLISLTLLIHN